MPATVVAIAVSLAGVGYLAGTDPKRRRAFRLPPATGASPRLGWALVLGPGLVLPFAAGGAGFTIWIGAVTVAGWAIAALPPERTAELGRGLERLRDRIAAWRPALPAIGSGAPRQEDDRIAALETRIRALEAQLREAGTHPAPSTAGNGHAAAPNGSAEHTGNGSADGAARKARASRPRAPKAPVEKVARPI